MNYEKQPQRIGDVLKLPRKSDGGGVQSRDTVLGKQKNKGANSERASLIGQFTDRLNLTRDGTKFKKLTYARIAALLAHLSKQDLYYLWSYCDKAKDFSKTFWWSLRPQK